MQGYKHNRFLPIRNKTLHYRTHISNPNSTYNLYDHKNMKVQVILYHWCRTDFINHVPISELHQWLFEKYPEITKRQVGRTVLQASTYDPRRLKGVTKDNPKATMIYIWEDVRDLQYGLEWMLSMWIWRLENEWLDIHENTNEQHRKMVNDIFEDLASCSSRDMHSLYADETENSHVFGLNERVDWAALWVKYGMEYERRSVSKTQGGRPRSFISTS